MHLGVFFSRDGLVPIEFSDHTHSVVDPIRARTWLIALFDLIFQLFLREPTKLMIIAVNLPYVRSL